MREITITKVTTPEGVTMYEARLPDGRVYTAKSLGRAVMGALRIR